MERRQADRVALAAIVVWSALAVMAGSHGGLAALAVVVIIVGLTTVAHRTGRYFNILAYLAAASFFGIPSFLIMLGGGI